MAKGDIKNENHAGNIKDYITYNLLLYLDSKDPVEIKQTIPLIKMLSEFYRVPLNDGTVKPLKPTLMRFILNKEGYSVTIKDLYNSIKSL